jgi:small subunit ribosomal protein S25e
MGGKKRQSLKQMEKAQQKKDKAGKKEKRASAPSSDKKSVPGITLPSLEGDKLVGELKKMKALTPYSVASRFDLRLSIARVFLKELEHKGIIEFVSSSRNLEIYKPAN